MNYSRVVLFSLLMFLTAVMISALGFLIFDIERAVSGPSHLLLMEVVNFVVLLTFYIYLAYRQKVNPYLHAICVTACYWFWSFLSSFVFSFFAELPFEPWAFLFPILFNIIALLLGTLSGIQLSLKLKSGAQTI